MYLRSRLLLALIVLLFAMPMFAQQTGAIHGRVTATDGSALPGVTVEARSNALPQPRVTTTNSTGDFRLPALQPGAYTLTFSLSGMQTATRRADVLLAQDGRSRQLRLVCQHYFSACQVAAATDLLLTIDRKSTRLNSSH